MLGKGRETLERAIELVRNGGEKYDFARVVYGDTDSLFILVPGLKFSFFKMAMNTLFRLDKIRVYNLAYFLL